jgi:hypothetical protein
VNPMPHAARYIVTRIRVLLRTAVPVTANGVLRQVPRSSVRGCV